MCFGWGGSGGHGDAQGAALPVKHLEDQLGVGSGWHRHGSRLHNTAYEYHLTFFSELRGAAVGLSGSIKSISVRYNFECTRISVTTIPFT